MTIFLKITFSLTRFTASFTLITGITGQKSANMDELKKSISEIRKYTSLPIVAGFGIKNKNHVKEICKVADGAVVGSSIVKIIEENVTFKTPGELN